MKRFKNPVLNILSYEWNYAGEYKKRYVFLIFLLFIAGIITLLKPLVVGNLFNMIQQDTLTIENFGFLALMFLSIFFIELGFWILHAPARVLEEKTAFRIHKNFTNTKIKQVLELPIKWQKDNHSGETIDKINLSRNGLRSFGSYMKFQMIYNLIEIFGSLFIIFMLNYKIGLIALGFSLVNLFFSMKMDMKMKVYYEKLNKLNNKFSGGIFDYLSNVITVITLRLKKVVRKDLDNKLEVQYKTVKKLSIFNELKWAIFSIFMHLFIALTLLYLVYNNIKSNEIILIGTLYMFYNYLHIIGRAFFNLSGDYSQIMKQNTQLENVYPIEDEFEKLKYKSEKELPINWNKIELKDINFKYNIEGHIQHLDNINLKFKRGEKIALIGESGSGKSTILSILRGLYSPQKGEVLSNDRILENGFSKLKQHITLIPQEPEIFNNTLRYNITMGLPVNKEILNKVIKMAQFEKVVKRLEKGLETNVLEKGVSLSGGEKQRLALARGLLAAIRHDIVLLDEPTSSVDNLNEIKIYDNILKEFKNKIIISSIHKLNLLEKFDYIYMFENGKIIGQGTLRELKQNKKFQEILRKYKNNKL